MWMERTFGSGDRKRVWRIIWTCCLLWSAQLSSVRAETGYGAYTPNHISADQAWRLVKQTHIGTVSPMPNANCLLITGTREQRNAVLGVLDLVDTSHTYEVTVLQTDETHWNESIQRDIGEHYTQLSIGTLGEPAAKGSGIRIMLDRVDDRVLVIAPSNWTGRIVTALTQGLSQGKSDRARLTNEAILRERPEPKAVFQDDLGRITQTLGMAGTQTTDSQSDTRLSQPSRGNGPQNQRIAPVPSSGASHINEYQSPQAPNGEDTLDLSLPEKVSIVDLLDLVGKYLGLDFMYDPDVVQGDVTLKLAGELEGPLKVKQLYPLLESVLKFRGYVMARRGDVVTVERAENWAEVDPDLRSDGGLIDFGEAVITRPFKLKYIGTGDAESLLESMKLGLSKSSIEETRTLIITEYSYRMPRIEALLELIDQPGDPRVFRSRRLQYTMARNLTDKVQALAEQLSDIKISVTAEETETSIPDRRPNETQAQYNRRVALARQAAARRAAANRRSSQQSEATSRDGVYLDADERTNSILMIGREEQLAIVMDLIDTLDVEQQDPRTPKLYEIEFVDAVEVRNKLQELGVISGYPDSRRERSGRITGQAQSDDGNATSAAARQRISAQINADRLAGESLLEEPQVVVIEQTNSLLINATAEQHAQISGLLKYIDSDTRAEAIPYTIYALKNQDPEEMAAILTQLIEETITDPEGKVERVTRRIDDEIVIVPDQTTYSLIVYASNRNQKWIKNLIEHLDKRRPQVLIDVTLVEISETDEFNYDLQVIESFPDLTNTSGVTSALIPGTETVNLVEALLSSNRDHYADFQSLSGSGTGFYADRHINALLTAMQSKNYGRVLAKPKILVNDNEPGTISTKDTTYVRTTGSVVPGTVGSTTEGGGLVQTSEQYDPYDAGITLEITPHISEGDLLKLEIALNRSDFTAEPADERPPNTNSSDLNTIVTVPDKSTIILGGMLKLNQSKGVTKVPILGDIPLVGGLFRSAGNSDTQKKLYVFVKAEIIRPTEVVTDDNELVRISDRNRAAFERHETKFQEYQGWPGLKSKVMSPEKVLDAD